VIAATAAALSLQPFRYERVIRGRGPGAVLVVPDGAMDAHARRDLGDVRIVDADGLQVPWRVEPPPVAAFERSLPVLDGGRRGALAVARVDVGRRGAAIDRLELQIPDRRFVGSVTVLGSDDRRSWTNLGTTQIYAVGGAAPARSTTALVPRADFRWFELRASHVSRITGVRVAATPKEEPLVRVPARVRGGAIDTGFANVPVDELRITSSTARYDRAFTVEAGGAVVAAGRLVRTAGRAATVVPVSTRARFLRLRIDNGDDAPLRDLRVEVLARPRPLLVEGGHRRPLRLYYGAGVPAPVYDFARLPAPHGARAAALGPEHANPAFRLVDTRSFFARHGSLVTVALALAALAVVAAGAIALRRSG
jgi:hypothetical protein